MTTRPPFTDPPRSPGAFPLITAAGGDVFAWWDTVDALAVLDADGAYRLVTCDPQPIVLFEANNRSAAARRQVDWLDFTIELVAGLAALFTGIRIGKDGYKLLKPVIELLWEDPGVQERVEAVGNLTQGSSPLEVGRGVIELWRYLWQHHRRTVFRGLAHALRGAIGPRALLEALVRWMARMISAGAALTVEIGLLVMPLGRKVRSGTDRPAPS